MAIRIGSNWWIIYYWSPLVSLRGLKKMIAWSQVCSPQELNLLTQARQRSTFAEWIFTSRRISCPQITLSPNFPLRHAERYRFCGQLAVNKLVVTWLLFLKPQSEINGPWSDAKFKPFERTSGINSISCFRARPHGQNQPFFTYVPRGGHFISYLPYNAFFCPLVLSVV